MTDGNKIIEFAGYAIVKILFAIMFAICAVVIIGLAFALMAAFVLWPFLIFDVNTAKTLTPLMFCILILFFFKPNKDVW